MRFSKNQHIICALLAFLTFFLLDSCKYGISQFATREDSIADRVSGLNSYVPSPTDEPLYKVLVVTDVHFGSSAQRYDDAFYAWLEGETDGKKNTDDIAFAICLGDVAHHGFSSEYEDYQTFSRRIEAALGGKRLYSIVGNHDLFNNGWAQWLKYVNNWSGNPLDTSFFMFKTKNIHWYFIDTGSGTMGRSQYKTLKAHMEKDKGPKVVCSHYPLYSDGKNLANYFTLQNPLETTRLIDLCATTDTVAFLSGHTHRYVEKDFGKFREINFSSLIKDARAEPGKWGLLLINEDEGTLKYKVFDADGAESDWQ